MRRVVVPLFATFIALFIIASSYENAPQITATGGPEFHPSGLMTLGKWISPAKRAQRAAAILAATGP
jgi:hypothetical protein